MSFNVPVSDTTTVSKGIIQLAGDLGGTADTPSVLGVRGVAITGTPTSGQVITASGSATASWTAPVVSSVVGKTGEVTLTKSDVGLASVDNTSDLNKPVSTATQAALNTKASLADFNNLSGSAMIKEDLYATQLLPTNMTAHTQILMHVALKPCALHQLSIAFSNSIVASDTNYWTAKVMRVNGTFAVNIAFKSTKKTGGEPINIYVDWNFDIFNLSGTAKYSKGDIFMLAFTPTGNPLPLLNPVATYRMGSQV